MATAITLGTMRKRYWLMPVYPAVKLKSAWPGLACL